MKSEKLKSEIRNTLNQGGTIAHLRRTIMMYKLMMLYFKENRTKLEAYCEENECDLPDAFIDMLLDIDVL